MIRREATVNLTKDSQIFIQKEERRTHRAKLNRTDVRLCVQAVFVPPRHRLSYSVFTDTETEALPFFATLCRDERIPFMPINGGPPSPKVNADNRRREIDVSARQLQRVRTIARIGEFHQRMFQRARR
ncbi:uncharacterized protein LOC122527159 [Frieseomelitta varia]|uniref:uncharacterized protein LOC122527159 n=1 Tax=Frieseomelitta varia TaxID=561572 RepID=UPI001CB6A7A5|nr:uncharacterized protein LOC122527159 [Frieseomelitta varia]